MRTHIITKGIINEYKKLSSSGIDTVLFIDNKSNLVKDNGELWQYEEFYGEKVKCFLLSEKKFLGYNLPLYARKKKDPSITEVYYENADYFLYIVHDLFPGYNFYWQFDYDVFMNAKDYSHFFKMYENDYTDVVIENFRVENETWCHYQDTDWIYSNVKKYASFFPVSRFSVLAINTLRAIRKEHAVIYKNTRGQWLNCELFVPTEIVKNNLTIKGLKNQRLRYLGEYDLNEDRLFFNEDGLLYHPVKGNYESRIKKIKDRVNKIAWFIPSHYLRNVFRNYFFG